MTPLPVNPTVVVQLDATNRIIAVASNIAEHPELTVEAVHSTAEFDEAAKGKPFKQRIRTGN